MAVNGGGEKNILALTLGRRASGRRGAVDGTLRASGRCGCGGGDRPEGRSNGGGDRWSSPVRAMEGEGRHGLAGCGAGLGVPRPRGCWPGSAKDRGAPVLEDQPREGGSGSRPGVRPIEEERWEKGGKRKKEKRETKKENRKRKIREESRKGI
jgi:hypothetical protein